MNWLVCCAIMISVANCAFADSPNVEAIRKKIFVPMDKPGCVIYTKNLQDSGQIFDNKFADFLGEFRHSLEAGDAKNLQALIHPRLNTRPSALKDIMASQRSTLGGPISVTPYVLYAMNTVDGNPTPLVCDGSEDTKLSITPQYGYNLEVGIWLQLMGQRELGRVFAVAVNKDDKWYLGTFHYQQWTHGGKSYADWYIAANDDAKAGLLPAAYLKADLAAKLLDGEGQFELSLHEEMVAYRDKLMVDQNFQKIISDILKDKKVIAAKSIFAKDGAGLMVRFEIPAEISTNDLAADCKKVLGLFKTEKWFGALDGLKCGYTMKGEDPNRDGRLGSLYLAKDS